ncbi:hypothetical protein NBRC116188_08490 [Oceaniserpentilla sp. 4NH20-0058]|uniref:hypothetical protein n=1 Tax=Oceaniserpentilla sp. 4NH20-0058 TaxID=3127660 RepID=UPI0031044F79
MQITITLSMLLLLMSCSSSSNNNNDRDLSNAISYSEIIERRLNNDASLNGSTVLISNEVHTSFKMVVQ